MAATAASASLAPERPYRGVLIFQMAFAALLSAAIALFFWIDSRYPSLLKKMHAGKGVHLSGALSFDALMPVSAGMSLFTRIEHTAVNWMWTNRVGMTFGVCFGAAMLTLLPLLPRLRFQSAAANTLAGGITGVPLGVCANCVAPIGKGMYDSGVSADTALATMISSPTLNLVVLSMAFALFPFRVALARLAFPLVLLAFVPWISGKAKNKSLAPESCPVAVNEGNGSAAWITKAYLKNLGGLALATIPLMIVAGVLGAVVAELIPAQMIPSHASILGIAAVAVIGTFLPTPIAFDVAAAFVLMNRGVPLPYVVTLLCTLGAFSVYPFFIVGRSISWGTATRLFATVVVLGTAAGVGLSLFS